MTNTSQVIDRVILEVAGTIATNGIQELSRDGDMNQFSYVRACLMATAYNSLRAMPSFSISYGAFCEGVLNQVTKNMVVSK